MSTKTTFKRVALVAVAALGLGLLSVAPSSAVQQSDTLAFSSATGSTEVGTAATVTLTQSFLGNNGDSMTVTLSVVSAPANNAAVPTLAFNLNGTNGQPSGTAQVGTLMDTIGGSAFATVTGNWTVTLPSTALVGTYVIKATPAYSPASTPVVATVAAAVTWTVTVSALATAAAPDSTTTAYVVPGATATVGSASVAVNVAASGSAIATIKVTPLVASAAATGSLTLSATISGPGTLSTPNQTGTTAASAGLKTTSLAGAQGGVFYVFVYGDGTTGTSTITLTLGSIVKTVTVNTYGAAASAVATVVKPVIAVGSTASVGAVTVLVKDAGGNIVPGAAVMLISGTPTVFATGTATVAAGSTGIAVFNLTGLVAGTSSLTFSNVAAGSTALYTSAAVSVRAGSDVASSVVMSLDKATYSQGEAATLTIMVKDAAGNTVADSSPTVFLTGGVTSSRALSAGTLPTDVTLTVGSSTGTRTYAINVPVTSGDFTISASAGSGLTGTFSVTATVSKSAAEIANADAIAAAADAAAEATDAANAATDAANAAAEAADAATAAAQDAADAVATLGTQVAELVAGLKAQIAAQKAAITALTNLVIKIQKKLKA